MKNSVVPFFIMLFIMIILLIGEIKWLQTQMLSPSSQLGKKRKKSPSTQTTWQSQDIWVSSLQQLNQLRQVYRKEARITTQRLQS